jgi:hypothetical protein
MSKRENETSLMKPADALSAFAHHTPGGVAAGFTGLENSEALLDGRSIPNPDYFRTAAVEQTVPPVAGGLDSTPTNWFELALDLCASGHITETRMRRAIEAVRKGVERE